MSELERVLDDIDALVDASLEGGEPVGGYDHGDPDFPRCGHCDRAWHGLPLTERVAAMYAEGCYDEDYRVADDDSRLRDCRGGAGPTVRSGQPHQSQHPLGLNGPRLVARVWG